MCTEEPPPPPPPASSFAEELPRARQPWHFVDTPLEPTQRRPRLSLEESARDR